MSDQTALECFIEESNKIEGIFRLVTPQELEAHKRLLALTEIDIADLQRFVEVIAPGKLLRNKVGRDVCVGGHVPPAGCPEIEHLLMDILRDAADGDPYFVHHHYEMLHPFMDGNGRSGRALWLWMMKKRGALNHALQLGFLHAWYYQSLQHSQLQSAIVSVPVVKR